MKYISEKTSKGNVGVSSLSLKMANRHAIEMDNAGCVNCTGCRDCRYCVGCEDCIGCVGCRDCESCEGCVGCRDCVGCAQLIAGRNRTNLQP